MAGFREFAKENSDGWSLIAARAGIDAVSEVIQGDNAVAAYLDNAPLRVMLNSKDEDGSYISFTPSPTERTVYAVSVAKSEWCILYRTLYWCEQIDHEWVVKTAAALSERLHCEAIASCGGGHGFLTRIYEPGEQASELPAYDHKVVDKAFASRKIRLPMCFIGGASNSLYANQDAIAEIERADRFDCHMVKESS